MNVSRIAAWALLAAAPLLAQFSYPGCEDLKASDFKKTEIFTRTAGNTSIDEPVQMSLHGVKGADGKVASVDVYFVGRKGQVKRFTGATKTVVDIGTITVWAGKSGGNNDNGLMGIALDPAFDASRLIYFWYAPPVANTAERRILRLARFKLTAADKLDMASEKILIEFRGAATDRYHSGGPMQFDRHGDLWIQVGNQSNDIAEDGNQFSKDSLTSDEWGASNTANMRGGTLRIHPDDSPKGYSVPTGNFGEYWAGEFDKQGKASLAAEYRDPKKVLPEIYIKGERSNFSIGVHPTKRWMAWGTVNYASSNDEFTAADHPVFSGFPYFHANNVNIFGFDKFYSFVQSAAAPRNESPLSSGVKQLPPAYPGSVSSLAAVAIGGAVYGFDASLDSPTKFPPHLDNTFVGFDFDPGATNPMWIFTVDPGTMKVTKQTRVDNGLLAGAAFRKPIQALYGPEGALYVLNYDGFYSTVNPGVMRFDYVGNCRVPVAVHRGASPTLEMDLIVSPEGVAVNETSPHEISLYDLAGNRILKKSGRQGAYYSFRDMQREFSLGKGLRILKVKSSKGEMIQNAYLP